MFTLVKVYKAISDSLGKQQNNELQSVKYHTKLPNLHYFSFDEFCIWKFCEVCTEKHFVVQRFIIIKYNSHVWYFSHAVFVKS